MPSRKIPPHRTDKLRVGSDASALLQALLDTPLASGDQRRPPVTLRSVDTQRYPAARRHAAQGWFDMLLLRSSQVLMIGALLVLGYWFVNVPLRNWLHNRGAPPVRAAVAMPSAAVMRISPTHLAIPVSSAPPKIVPPTAQNDLTLLRQRALAASTASASAQIAALPATQVPTSIVLTHSPGLAMNILPTASPQATASPMIIQPSPTTAWLWPIITPVPLGTVSKPSPAPILRTAAIVQPGVPARSHGASAAPTRLIIPALGLDLPIKEVFIVGNQWQVAEYAAGYLNGSGLPGVPGNLALDGHAGLYGAAFANLGALKPGDDIYVDASGVRYHYRLRTASTVLPNQVDVLDSTETPTMTLITCTHWDTQRLVAQADFVDSGLVLES